MCIVMNTILFTKRVPFLPLSSFSPLLCHTSPLPSSFSPSLKTPAGSVSEPPPFIHVCVVKEPSPEGSHDIDFFRCGKGRGNIVPCGVRVCVCVCVQ